MNKHVFYLFVLLLGLSACAGKGLKQKKPPPPEVEVESNDGPKFNPEKAVEANVQLGIEYMRMGRNQIAMDKLQRALEIDDRSAQAHEAVAILYERLRQIEKAEEHYTRAIKLNPDDSGTQNNYGSFLCRQGKPEEAEEHFLKAISNPLYAKPEIAYTNAAMCFIQKKDFAKVRNYLDKALEISPRFPVALYQKAKLLYEKENYQEAESFLERYLKEAPHNAQTLWLGIRIARYTGHKNKEASYSLLLRNKFPDSEETRELLQSGNY